MHQNIMGNIKVLSKKMLKNCNIVERKSLEGLKGQNFGFILHFHTI